MKRYNYIYAIALAGGMLMAACSQNEETTIPTPANTFRISVVDEGINAGNAAARATTDADYKTTFEEDDKIGLFMVDGGTTTGNICLTMDSEGNWIVPEGTTLSQTATYHAYYPYDETLSTLATEEDPFATWISGKTLVADQSTAAKYAANDLMTTMEAGVTATKVDGTNDYTITLAMKHRMALVVVSLPSTVYKFTNSNVSLSDYVIPVSNPTFKWGDTEVTPLQVGSTYRFLVKPAETKNLSGTFDSTKQYSVENVSIAEGNYHLYEVDKSDANTVSFELSVGDYYCNDGTLIASDANLTDDDKTKIIGIVAAVGYNNETFSHGMVYALKRAERPSTGLTTSTFMSEGGNGSVTVSSFYESHGTLSNDPYLVTWASSDVEVNNKTGDSMSGTTATTGYANTVTWLEQTTQGLNDNMSVMLSNYKITVPAPSASSDWYIPSYADLKTVFSYIAKRCFALW